MSQQKSTRALILLGVFSLVSGLALGCQKSAPVDTQPGSQVDLAANAYRDYVRGDCGQVERQANADRIKGWESTEVRHSMVLLRGFCQERSGNVSGARDTYRELVQQAPLSFASDDARERLRILRVTERDPDYAAWVAGARERHARRGTNRIPVDRIPASFPPLAHEAEIEGYAIVEFGITPRGDTDTPVIVESEPPLLFDGVALRAVREWRYARDLESQESQRQVIRILFRPRDAESTLDESMSPDQEAPDQAPSDTSETSIE